MKNWIKGGLVGVTLAVSSILGGAVQAATVPYDGAVFSTTGSVNGSSGYSIKNGQSITFDFSALQYSSIVSFVLEVVYKQTSGEAHELWSFAATGGASNEMTGVGATSTPPSTTLTLVSGDAGYAQALSAHALTISFLNSAIGATTEAFFLKTGGTPPITKLTINYTPVSAVPLPAGGLLLLTGLGGLALARRRKER
jgi:hypothetical protein